ncbi:MAG: carboxypeptidase regulatory-like domain-containing protein [Terriglobia bacterium]
MSGPLCAQEGKVTGRLTLQPESARAQPRLAADAVVWLVPLDNASHRPASSDTQTAPRRFSLVQRQKRFEPHVLPVPKGSAVEFPNYDPVFHNVFSLFNGKRFDLGLYESGATRAVIFDRPGICYIFCNIHPEMSAVVVVLETPYFAVSNAAGEFAIPAVPAGRYRVHVFHERCLPEFLRGLAREVIVSADGADLGTIHLAEAEDLRLTHKNKYGQEYDPPAPRSPLYQQP